MESGYDWRLGLGEYLLGFLVLSVILATVVLIGRGLCRRLLPGWSGPPAWLVMAVLACATLLLSAELLGLFALFTRPVYSGSLLALAAVVVFFTRGEGRGSDVGIDSPAPAAGPMSPARVIGGRASMIAAAVVAAIILGRAIWAAIAGYDGGMSGFDTHWYHGPFTALFLQSGETFSLNNSIAPQYLSWFYPHNSELLQAISTLPFDRDLLSPALNLLWLVGALLAAWCIGRPFGMAPFSLIAAALILGSGLLSDQVGEMRNDIPAVFFVLAAAAIAINAWGAPRRGALVVIGLAAGLAAGTKLNYLATAGALIIALALAMPKGQRGRGFGLLLGSAVVGGGYWYLRNLIHSGNPLPWITSLGPLELPGPEQEIGGREGHGVFEYLFDATIWRDWFLPGLRETLTLAWPLVLVAAAATTVLLLLGPAASARGVSRHRRPSVHRAPRGGGQREPMPGERAPGIPVTAALGLTILATVAAWLVAPASAEGPAGEPVGFVSGLRYLAPALALALALFPVAIRPNHRTMAGAASGMGERTGREERTAGPWQEADRRGRMSWRRPVVLALACVLGGACVAGFFLQRYYLEHRYANPDFSTPGLNEAFAEASRAAPKPDGAPPIAVTATRIYAFFGPDLKQPVAYVGIAESDGGFRRPEDCAEWRRAVNETGAERLIVAWDRLAPGQPPLPPEAAWIEADQAAKMLTSGGGAASFELTGALNPDACA